MNTTTPRPKWNDEIRKELSERVGKDIYDWCKGDTDLEDCVQAAYDVLRYSHTDNGYEIAKDLERHYFSPDVELVEILDGVSSDSYEIIRKHQKQWVKDNGIALELPIGAIVKTKIMGKEVEGEIVKQYDEEAKYGVCVESMGQVKGKSHYIVNYEDVLHSSTSPERSVAPKAESEPPAPTP